ncbi:hypothetical protein LMG22465_15890 [Lactobacillus helveticus]|nr:hypothetical protein LMG22465_15890 [Lactobacillus helveticus]
MTVTAFRLYGVIITKRRKNMKKQDLSVKNVVAMGIGSAIYVILARFTSIPTPIPNS